MKSLFFSLNLFDKEQNITILEDGQTINTYAVPTEEVGQKIADICAAEDITDVFIKGTQNYVLQKIIPELDKRVDEYYSSRKVEVHIL